MGRRYIHAAFFWWSARQRVDWATIRPPHGCAERPGLSIRHPRRTVEPPRGAIESEFLRTVLLGESIAPFRLLTPALAVIPARGEELLDTVSAANAGCRHLAAWLRDIEAKWMTYCSKRSDGIPRMILKQQLDHMRKLSAQLAPAGLRVVYTKPGTLLSAAALDDPRVMVDHKAY